MSYHDADIIETSSQPRAQGAFVLAAKTVNGVSRVDNLRTSGSFKALFPRRAPVLEAIMINTSGGLTGGDRFSVDVDVGPDTIVDLTTQAAERAYRSNAGTAQVTSRLKVAAGATLSWLPQELIVFDRSALDRRLKIDLEPDAQLLMVEPIVFGRTAMGETLGQIALEDRIEISRAGHPLYLDSLRVRGHADELLSRKASAKGAHAMVSVVYVAPDAEAQLENVRAALPVTGGASLIAPDALVLRLLAPDGFLLRKSLVPLLEILKGSALPRSWSL